MSELRPYSQEGETIFREIHRVWYLQGRHMAIAQLEHLLSQPSHLHEGDVAFLSRVLRDQKRMIDPEYLPPPDQLLNELHIITSKYYDAVNAQDNDTVIRLGSYICQHSKIGEVMFSIGLAFLVEGWIMHEDWDSAVASAEMFISHEKLRNHILKQHPELNDDENLIYYPVQAVSQANNIYPLSIWTQIIDMSASNRGHPNG